MQASTSYKTVTKTIEEKVADGVVLHLSQEEAQHLYNIAGDISGGGEVRQTVNKLYFCLGGVVNKKSTSPFYSTPTLKD